MLIYKCRSTKIEGNRSENFFHGIFNFTSGSDIGCYSFAHFHSESIALHRSFVVGHTHPKIGTGQERIRLKFTGSCTAHRQSDISTFPFIPLVGERLPALYRN